jgi:hypothetical protein
MSLYVLTASIYLLISHKNLHTNYYLLVLMPFALLAAAYWYSVLNEIDGMSISWFIAKN